MDYHLVYCSILQVILHICSAFVCSFIFPCFISKSLKDKLNVERGVFVSFPKRQFKILLECDDSGRGLTSVCGILRNIISVWE